jgi:NAD dependent epimerase/dehydratase family
VRTTQLSITLGKEAARRKCKAFVEVSTGIVYSPDRKPSTESSPLKPWLGLARAKLDAEAALSRISDLNLVILRLAHVYGEYNAGFASKFLCLARVYQEQGRELKWLWTEELRVNGVWVGDVCRAILEAARWRGVNVSISDSPVREEGKRRPTLLSRVSSKSAVSEEEAPLPGTPVFNIVDRGDTNQGTVARLTSEVFGIKTGFQGSLISQFAKLNLESVVDDLNDEILQPWADMLEQKGLRGGRLSPFLEKELLGDKDLSMDGSLFEKTTGFTYQREGICRGDIEEMIESYRRVGWWP